MNEKPNEYNIMEGSMLILQIIEARELYTLAGSAPNSYVEVEVGENKLKTNVKNQTSSPNWNEKATLKNHSDIVTGQEQILRIKNQGTFRTSDSIIGELMIPLDYLRDQNEKEEWRDIMVNNRKNGRIRIRLTWIYSNVKRYEDLLGDEETKRSNLTSEKSNWQQLLDVLQGKLM